MHQKTECETANQIMSLQKAAGYWKNLNGLRGFLCLVVFAAHFARGFSYSGSLEFLNALSERGTHAPEIFFVISGFLLMNSFRSTGIGLTTAQYYGRRAFRIFPLLWIAVLFENFFYSHAADVELFKNLFLLNGIFPYREGDLYPFVAWSLAVEETYYLAMPLIGRYSSLLIAAVAVILLQVVGSIYWYELKALVPTGYEWHQPVFTFFNLFIGILIYHVYTDGYLASAMKSRYFSQVFDVLAVVILCIWTAGHNILDPLLGGCLLAGALLNKSLFSSLLWKQRLLQYAGTRCFSIYLIHPMVLSIAGFNEHAGRVLSFIRELPFAGIENLICLALVLSAVLLISELAYRVIEKPLTELGKTIFISPAAAVLHPHSPPIRISP